MRSRGVLSYLALAFVPAWLAWAAVGAAGGSMDDPVTQLVTAAFIPALAAIVVRRWVTREGFADAGLRPRLRAHWPTYLFALAVAPVFLGIALGLAWAAGYWSPSETEWSDHALFLIAVPVIPVLAAPIFFGEEFGWTAYLRDRLLPGRPIATTFLTGLIWGVWHWPLPWVGYFGAHVDAGEAVIAMLLWVPLSIMLEFVIGFVWGRTGSVWPSCLVHGGGNLVVAVGLDLLTGSAMSVTASTVLYILAMTPVVAVLLIAGRWRVRPVTPRAGSAG
ncbi:CPBP family intramembrane glutamic endopeptidase [Mycolicibacterium sp. F2034L]|uniref:CPBP family glutamic-type intramembrane protease n=1 Tax=Mycolicibacterium sp. F2034L TaxID=2926422 RepID=UPI001FF3A408|nr:CPBP family intramembrane glutamic endopeptidase [Mycolicibacterium sp. F2034L]MCK0177172.1 CPBP family intramembrane metalloprotease [Mycolicibacterium sp. F2034L]